MITIDTGKKGGAVSFYDDGRIKSFFKFEMMDDIMLNMFDFHDWLAEQNDNEVVIERIPPIPKQSVVSTATQFFHVGAIYSTVYIALGAVGLDLRDTYPRTWTSAINLVHNSLPEAFRTDSDKMKLIVERVARHFYPEDCLLHTKRTRTDDAFTDCIGIYIWANIDKFYED